MKNATKLATLLILLGCALALVIGTPEALAKKKTKTKSTLSGNVIIDGSSTVFPISQAVAEDFQAVHKVRVSVGLSGTGGGFKKFAAEKDGVDITGASRPIEDNERDILRAAKFDYIELPVAYDGIAVIVHPDNTYVNTLTVKQLKKLWSADGGVIYWSDVNPEWPKKKISFFSPGADSGTFDYFKKTVVGKKNAFRRKNLTASEDDNVLVTGVSRNKYAIGYFGYAYYAENKGSLKIVGIDDGTGAVIPSPKTIENATYKPLSRPVFIYVKQKSLTKPQVTAFVDYYLDNARRLTGEVGYVPLTPKAYENAKTRFTKRMLGTVFGTGKTTTGPLEANLLKEGVL